MFGEIEEPALEIRCAHVFRAEIDIEQGAKLPGAILKEAALALEPMIKRGPWKRR